MTSSLRPTKPGTRPCGCGHPDCDLTVCVECGDPDCKMPGSCYSRCQECGALHDVPSGAQLNLMPVYRDDGRMWMSVHCSEACSAADRLRLEAEGRLVKISDLTIERVNDLLGAAGLTLGGVSKVQPS